MQSAPNIKFCCGIILYNPSKDVVDRLAIYSEKFDRVFVYDNSRTSNEKICSHFNNISYFFNGKNDGMSVALNCLYLNAWENGYDYILTMDQDTDFPKDEIQKIIDVIQSDKYKGSALFTSNWRKVYKRGQREEYGSWKYNKDNKITVFAMTSGTFYNLHILRKYLPLPDLFIGMVDDDISYELLRDKKFGVMVGAAKLSQRVGETVEATMLNKLLHKVILSPERYYYMGRNSEYLLQKYKYERDIVSRIKKTRFRILGNLILCETPKITKMKMWLKGIREIKDGNLKLGKYDG